MCGAQIGQQGDCIFFKRSRTVQLREVEKVDKVVRGCRPLFGSGLGGAYGHAVKHLTGVGVDDFGAEGPRKRNGELSLSRGRGAHDGHHHTWLQSLASRHQSNQVVQIVDGQVFPAAEVVLVVVAVEVGVELGVSRPIRGVILGCARKVHAFEEVAVLAA